jgi:LmbE family N-acetylglucosaminyl deacetylase
VGRNCLWLLAHQDDEILGLHLYSSSVRNLVVYLSDGVRDGANFDSLTRVREARESWIEIDKNAELIFFGTDHSLRDGELQNQMNAEHLHSLISICQERNIDEIITLQLEGGHQDHDITSLMAEEICRRLSLKFVAYPAYRALHKKFPIYTVMSSASIFTKKNTHNVLLRICFAVKSIRLMKRYRSQITTWIGLGPFVILQYLLGGPAYVELLHTESETQENPKNLLYLNRNKQEKIEYESFRRDISGW